MWDQYERLNGPAHSFIHLIGENANDGVRLDHPGTFAARIDLLSQGILAVEIFMGQRLINHRDKRTAAGVIVSDVAPAHQRSAENPSVIATDR